MKMTRNFRRKVYLQKKQDIYNTLRELPHIMDINKAALLLPINPEWEEIPGYGKIRKGKKND